SLSAESPETSPGDSEDDTVRKDFSNPPVARDEQVSRGIYSDARGKSECRRNGRPTISTETFGPIAAHSCDDSVFADLADSVVETIRYEKIANRVYGDAVWRQTCEYSWAAISVEATKACSSYCVDDPIWSDLTNP